MVLLLEALMRVLEAGLRHLALVGNGIFLGHALGGGAHLHRWLVRSARRAERTWDGCFLGPLILALVQGWLRDKKFLSLSLLLGLQELHAKLGQGRDPKDVSKGSYTAHHSQHLTGLRL